MSEEKAKKEDNKIVIIITIIITALIMSVGFYFWYYFISSPLDQNNLNFYDYTNNTLENDFNVTIDDYLANEELIYNNFKFGFSLSFPETWKNYTYKYRKLNFGNAGEADSIDFAYYNQEVLFNISIHTKEQWIKIKEEKEQKGGPMPTYINENKYYIFAYSKGHHSDDENIVLRMGEVEDIIKTFSLLDLLKYANEELGFSFMYPAEFKINSKMSNNDFILNVEIENINNLEHPAYSTELAIKDKDALANAYIYQNEAWSLDENILLEIDNNYAQHYISVSSFDVCSVYFKNSIKFFINDNIIRISLYGPKKRIIDELDDYFYFDLNNCGSEEKVWRTDKLLNEFKIKLKNNQIPELVNKWYKTIFDIADSLKFSEIKQNNLKQINDLWYLYTNNELGFSIEIPRTDSLSVYVNENTPVIYFNVNDINIKNIEESIYQQIQNTSWAILIYDIDNDDDLRFLIQKVYGENCFLGEKILKDNFYNVSITGSNCLAHMSNPLIKYSKEFKKAAIWNLGHEPSFWLNNNSYDYSMINSFKFIN